ncbi:unnamed protein product, partial [Allacma fusca]
MTAEVLNSTAGIAEECENTNEPATKRFRSEVWDHFNLTNNDQVASCKYCKTVYKLSKGKGSTANMNVHLKKAHPGKLHTHTMQSVQTHSSILPFIRTNINE